MKKTWKIETNILEQGNIFFFYKPKKGKKYVRQFEDIGRFYVVLKPEGSNRARYIVMGTKRMPSLADRERGWGMVTKVGGRGFATTSDKPRFKTAGARPSGEGVYALVRHLAHTHLVYQLELPHRLGEVQRKLHIAKQGNYVLSIKSPQIPPPSYSNLPDTAKYYPTLESKTAGQFKGRRYMTVHTPSLLDNEGSTLFVMGVNTTLSNLGVSVDKDKESEISADIFSSLKLNKTTHSTKPLFEGRWD